MNNVSYDALYDENGHSQSPVIDCYIMWFMESEAFFANSSSYHWEPHAGNLMFVEPWGKTIDFRITNDASLPCFILHFDLQDSRTVGCINMVVETMSDQFMIIYGSLAATQVRTMQIRSSRMA